MRIVSYDVKYKQDFIKLNRAWISDMFVMGPEDERELGNIEGYLEQGGQIFFAIDDDDAVMACCMIAPREDGDWELMKFAARGMYTGTGAGTASLKACIAYAKEQNVPKIILSTNRKCETAIRLYRKFGFVEIPVDKDKFPFERCDAAFELQLQ